MFRLKVKRIFFIFSLIVLFLSCYMVMNEKYDEFSRYPYELKESQRKQLLDHLDADGINTLISWKIKPNQILPYIGIDGFIIENTLWYDQMAKYTVEKVENDFIVSFVNKYKEYVEFENIKDLLNNYSYNDLIHFFDEGDVYQKNVHLLPNPSNLLTLIKKNETIYHYEPDNLVDITNIPYHTIVSDTYYIRVHKELLNPLTSMLNDLGKTIGKPFGDLKVVVGYLSYEDQVSLYDVVMKKYGKEDLLKYWDLPGHSEYQLGYSVSLIPSNMKPKITNKVETSNVEQGVSSDCELTEDESEQIKSLALSKQAVWLKDHAHKYGFIIRYPEEKEDITKKEAQPFTLRYVGRECATMMFEQELCLEEVDFDDL